MLHRTSAPSEYRTLQDSLAKKYILRLPVRMRFSCFDVAHVDISPSLPLLSFMSRNHSTVSGRLSMNPSWNASADLPMRSMHCCEGLRLATTAPVVLVPTESSRYTVFVKRVWTARACGGV